MVWVELINQIMKLSNLNFYMLSLSFSISFTFNLFLLFSLGFSIFFSLSLIFWFLYLALFCYFLTILFLSLSCYLFLPLALSQLLLASLSISLQFSPSSLFQIPLHQYHNLFPANYKVNTLYLFKILINTYIKDSSWLEIKRA